MHVWKMVVFVAVATHRGSCLRAHVQCDAGGGRVGRWWYKQPRWCFQILLFIYWLSRLEQSVKAWTYFSFHPDPWGNDPIWLYIYNMFQMGWNHQLEAHLKEITPFQSGRYLHHTLGIFQPFFSGCFTGPKKLMIDQSGWLLGTSPLEALVSEKLVADGQACLIQRYIRTSVVFWWFQKGSPN